MEEKKAIIFDLDGVICFTDKYHYLAWKKLADELEIPFDETINNRLRGVSRMASLDIILENADKEYSAEDKERFASDKNALYRTYLEKMTPEDVSGEVRTTLSSLRNRGFLLAVGSSSKNAKLILSKIGLADFFDAVADGTEISHSKPDPEVFLLAAQKLKTSPDSCVVIEDAKSGIQAAKAAGMTAFALFGDAKDCGLEDVNLLSFSDLLLHV